MPTDDSFFPSQRSQFFLGTALQLFACHAAQLRRPATLRPWFKNVRPTSCFGTLPDILGLECRCRCAPDETATRGWIADQQNPAAGKPALAASFAFKRQKKANLPEEGLPESRLNRARSEAGFVSRSHLSPPGHTWVKELPNPFVWVYQIISLTLKMIHSCRPDCQPQIRIKVHGYVNLFARGARKSCLVFQLGTLLTGAKSTQQIGAP
jgi:hypothetical protein